MESMHRSTPSLLPALLLLAACGPDLEQPLAPLSAPQAVGSSWSSVQPEGLLDFVEDPSRVVPLGLACPVIDVVDGIETWTGGCALLDGTVVEGSLQRFEGPDGSWIEGEQLAVWVDDQLVTWLDGAIQLVEDGDLILLDAAATTCGAHVDCIDGPVALDLRYTLLPLDLPSLDLGLRAYDATVRGFVAPEEGDAAAVEGAWRVDLDVCEGEPVDGIFAVQLTERHTLELDGGSACDGCAERTVQGVSAGAWCDAGT